ncbi:MAG: diacylglycerol kinase [Clostridia bacterium]
MKKRAIKWFAAALCLGVFLFIAFNLNHIAWLDHAVYGVVSSWISPAATTFFTLCTQLVGPLVLLVISLGLVLFLPRKEYRIPVLMNLCAAILLNLGLKHIFTRPRPVDVVQIVVESGYSFPSGHTMAATCFYGFLIYLVWQLCTNKIWRNAITALLCTMIALVALSRVYLGAHYFSDVLAGLCFSVFYLIVFSSIVHAFFAQEITFRPHGLRPTNSNRLLFSFLYAFEGIAAGLKSEHNMVIHFSAMTVVIVFGAMLGLSTTEWIACILLFGVVLMAELINTAIETVVDIICPELDPRAKLAKDTAAGAVLVASISAAIIGAMIFIPKLLELIRVEL